MNFDYTANNTTELFDPRLSDQLQLGYLICDRFGLILNTNHIARQILGLKEDQVGISCYDLSHLFSDNFQAELDYLINNHQELVKKNHVIKNLNGEVKNINITGRINENSEEKELVFYLNEISPTNKSKRRCLDVVSQVAQAITSSISNDEILNVILSGTTAEQGLGFNRAYIFLYDDKDQSLKGHRAVGPIDHNEADEIWRTLQDKSKSLDSFFTDNPEHFVNYNRSINQKIRTITVPFKNHNTVKEICHKKEFAILSNAGDDGELLNLMGVSKLVLAPMISNDKLIGLIAADNEITQQMLDEQACYILQILANQAAVAIERSSLYAQITAKADELEKAYQKLTESQEQIIKVEKMSAIGELTASIAHELKNPMAIVGGFAHLLLKNKDKSDNDEYLKIITQEIKRAEEVLEHVLEFSRTSQNEKVDFDFNELITEVLGQIRSRLNLPRLDLVDNLSDKKIRVNGNYDQLKYAIYQIVKLLIGDIIMPAKISLQLSRQNSRAGLDIIVEPDEENRSYTRKNLSKTFLGNKLSQRLPILVADEALRFHGGGFKFYADENQPIQLMIQLPLKEADDEK